MRRFSHYLFIFGLVTATLLILVQGIALASKHPPTKHVVSQGKPEGSRDATAGCASNPNPQNCDHHDPANLYDGCTDAVTENGADILDLNNNRVGRLEIRGSSICASVWARVTNYDGDGIGILANITRQTDNAYDDSAAGPLTNGYRIYSSMLFGLNVVRTLFSATGYITDTNGNQFSNTINLSVVRRSNNP